MGGAGSSLLNEEQKAVISKSLQEQFDYCQALGMEPELINDTLTIDYHKNIRKLYPDYVIPDFERHGVTAAAKRRNSKNNLTSQPSSRRGSFDRPSLSRRNSGDDLRKYMAPTAASLAPKVVTNAKQKKGTRRRSYDSPLQPVERTKEVLNTMMDINEQTPALPEQPVSPETPALPREPEQPVDSWDSITEMPYCTTCEMAFKSKAFLDRHRKYSEIHAYNDKKKNGPTEGEVAGEKEKVKQIELKNTLPLPENNDPEGKQVEGTHYKLLYHGSKLFWKNQKTYELHIYHHILPHTLEVIAFDVGTFQEMPRIYLDYTSTASNVESPVDAALAERVAELSVDRFATIDKIGIREVLLRNAITHFVLQRLKQNEVTMDFGEMITKGITINHWEADKVDPCRSKIPPTLVPVRVVRRRASSADEIDSQIDNIKSDIGAAMKYNKKAEKIANLVNDTAFYLQKKKWWQDKEISKIQLKWIKAIKRVINSTNKEKVMAMLKEKGVSFTEKRRPSLTGVA